jgi:HlyD family secretion protein
MIRYLYVFRTASVGLLMPLVLAGCSGSTKTPTAPADGAVSAAITRVTVDKPQRKTLIAKTTQPARVEAFEQTPLFSKIAGYVDEVHVDIGDKVTKNQPLVTLRVPELGDDVRHQSALVAEAAAGLKQAEANVTASNAGVETATAKISEAKAGITRAAGEYERWKSEYERVKALAGNGSVTQKLADETLSQFHAAEAASEAAEAAIQSAEAAARQAQANAAKAEADRVASEAHLAVANAELAHAKTMLDYATIRSPYDGVVTKRSVDTGHFVQPAANSAAPLMTVARVDKVRVYVEIPEMESAGVDVGDRASIHLQALPGGDIEFPVTRTSWSLDPANRSLRAEIDIPNEGAKLRPGMYATGAIEMARRENALAIPSTAVVRDGSATLCCVVTEGKVERRPIKLGIRSGPDVEVLEGLSGDEAVVQIRAESLTAGQAVEASAAPSK